VIEDTPSGIEAGRRAGMRTLAVAATHPRGELSNADGHIDALSEILELAGAHPPAPVRCSCAR
jgi:sugar-phosphatase